MAKVKIDARMTVTADFPLGPSEVNTLADAIRRAADGGFGLTSCVVIEGGTQCDPVVTGVRLVFTA